MSVCETDGLTTKEAVLLDQSKRRGKDTEGVEGTFGASSEGRRKVSYRHTVLGDSGCTRPSGFEKMEDGEMSDDDLIEESSDATWFGVSMAREEKIEARLP